MYNMYNCKTFENYMFKIQTGFIKCVLFFKINFKKHKKH